MVVDSAPPDCVRPGLHHDVCGGGICGDASVGAILLGEQGSELGVDGRGQEAEVVGHDIVALQVGGGQAGEVGLVQQEREHWGGVREERARGEA